MPRKNGFDPVVHRRLAHIMGLEPGSLVRFFLKAQGRHFWLPLCERMVIKKRLKKLLERRVPSNKTRYAMVPGLGCALTRGHSAANTSGFFEDVQRAQAPEGLTKDCAGQARTDDRDFHSVLFLATLGGLTYRSTALGPIEFESVAFRLGRRAWVAALQRRKKAWLRLTK